MEKAIAMTLYDSEQSRRMLWPNAFRLRQKVVVGANLALALQTINHDVKPFTITQALYSYFAVGDVRQVQVNGLNGVLPG